MNDFDSLPLVNPPLDPPPNAGVRFRDRAGFVYDVVEAKPHTNRDGSASWLITLQCQCADCGSHFLHKQGPKRATLPRRCQPHAAGKGREKVHPFGRAPSVAPGQRPRSEEEVVKPFFSGIMDRLEALRDSYAKGSDLWKGANAMIDAADAYFLAAFPDEPEEPGLLD